MTTSEAHHARSQLDQLREMRSGLDPDDPRHAFFEETQKAFRQALGDAGDHGPHPPSATLSELADEVVTIEHAVVALTATSPWVALARLCYERTRKQGASQRVYGALWGSCYQKDIVPPSRRTFGRLVRLGGMMFQWEVEEEDVRGLTWRQAFNVLRAAEEEEDERGDDLPPAEVRRRLRQEKRRLL